MAGEGDSGSINSLGTLGSLDEALRFILSAGAPYDTRILVDVDDDYQMDVAYFSITWPATREDGWLYDPHTGRPLPQRFMKLSITSTGDNANE